MRSRCLLHKTKLNDFRQWLESKDWVHEKEKGDYEVLRMKHKEQGYLLIYDYNGKEHLTTFGIGYNLVQLWINKRKTT